MLEHHPIGGHPVGAAVWLPAARTPRPRFSWPSWRAVGRNVPQQAVEVPIGLVQPLARVLDLPDTLLPVSRQLLDPRQNDRTPAHALRLLALDFLDFPVGKHGRQEAKIG